MYVALARWFHVQYILWPMKVKNFKQLPGRDSSPRQPPHILLTRLHLMCHPIYFAILY